MEIETLKAKGRQYNPDLVIIAFIGNDLKLLKVIRKEENYFSLRRSFAIEYFSDRLTKRRSNLHDGLVDAPLNASGDDIESDPSRVPAQYSDMVGVDAYRVAMSELKALSLKQNFQVVVFTTYFPGFVKAILEGLDLPILEAGDTFTIYMSNHGIKEYMGSPLTVSDQDPHPSALGHTILANVLYNYLRDNGILSSILERHRASSLAK